MLLFTSCKTISVQNKQYHTTTQKVSLGSIGMDENFPLEHTYNYLGIPNYNKPIKVSVTPIFFTTTTYNAYVKAKESQPNTITVNYADSLKVKPRFVNIQTEDKIELITILNETSNKDVKAYLLNQNQSHIVTNISMVLKDKVLEALTQAEEVFIEANGIKSLALKLYNNGELKETINFNEGVVFAYRASSACWKENSKYQLEIVDLVEGDNTCPSKTYKSPKRAKKKINYYKF
jgi:hypothetical protein